MSMLRVLLLALGFLALVVSPSGGQEPAPDPAIAFESGDEGLKVMNEDGSNVSLLLAAADVGGYLRLPAWSPDGAQLVFKIDPYDTAKPEGIYTVNVGVVAGEVVASGLTHVTDFVSGPGNGLCWSPVPINGVHRIAFNDRDAVTGQDGRLNLVNADGSGGRIGLNKAAGVSVRSISWSPDGSRLAVARGNGRHGDLRVHTLAVDGNGDVYVADSPVFELGGNVRNVAWSNADENILVLAAVPEADPALAMELWRIDLSDAVPTGDPGKFTLGHVKLTTNIAPPEWIDDHAPWFSPDDSRVVFQRGGWLDDGGLWLVNADGSGSLQVLLENPPNHQDTAWYMRPAWRRRAPEPPVLESITVAPGAASVGVGGTQQFTATGHYAGGSTQDLTATAGWTSSNGSVASVTSGLATGLAVGTANITASLGDVTSNAATLTVTAAQPGTIASDGFESRDFSGGSGWAGAWTVSGDVKIRTNKEGPHSGSSHVRLRRGTGYLERAVDLAGATGVTLRFYAKVKSFEGSDQAYVKVSPDGDNWTTVKTFSAADSDNAYHLYEIDLSGFAMTAEFAIAFDAAMSAKGDRWYLDDIEIVGIGGG